MHRNIARVVGSVVIVSASTLAIDKSANAQWVDSDTSEFHQAMDLYTAKFAAMQDYELHSTVSSYRNITDREPDETAQSIIWKRGDRMKAEHLGVITYQDKTLRVMIDPQERMIYLAKPEAEGMDLTMEMRSVMMQAATKVQKMKTAEGILYRLHFPKSAKYSSVEVGFDTAGWLRTIVSNWAQPIVVDPGNPLSDVVLPKVVLKVERPRTIAGQVGLTPYESDNVVWPR